MSSLDKVLEFAAPTLNGAVTEHVGSHISAIDAILDEACSIFSDQNTAALSPDLQQACALVYAASELVDCIMEEKGIPNPDQMPGYSEHVATYSNKVSKVLELASKSMKSKMPYGDVTYADPGYQKDGKKRYPLDSEGHVRAAWSYINQSKNQTFYSSDQVAKIKAKIIAASKKYGIQIADQS